MFRYIVSAVCTVFYESSKTESAGLLNKYLRHCWISEEEQGESDSVAKYVSWSEPNRTPMGNSEETSWASLSIQHPISKRGHSWRMEKDRSVKMSPTCYSMPRRLGAVIKNRMHSFLWVVKDGKCRTQLCAVKSARVTRPLLSGCCSSQWESAVYMMMMMIAEGDESLQLFHRRKTRSLPCGKFSGNVDWSCIYTTMFLTGWRFSADR